MLDLDSEMAVIENSFIIEALTLQKARRRPKKSRRRAIDEAPIEYGNARSSSIIRCANCKGFEHKKLICKRGPMK